MEVVSTIAKTEWERGRFDTRDGPNKLLFGRMYEDAAIELGAFRPGGRVFCIASAGCTALALAPRHEVVAVDINPVQLAYVQRRLANGALQQGVAERLLGFARAFGPMVGWSQSKVHAFLALLEPAAQMGFWRRHLNTSPFRATVDVLFSTFLLRSVYRSSLLGCLPQNFGAVMRRRMARCFSRHPNQTNSYAHALLLGEISPEAPEAGDIQLVCADAADFLESQPAGSFDGFALSNILDGAGAAYAQRLFAAVKHAAAPGAVAVLRSFGEPSAVVATNHAADDRAMLWGIVDVRLAIDL